MGTSWMTYARRRCGRPVAFAVCLASLLLAPSSGTWVGVANAHHGDGEEALDNGIATNCDDFRFVLNPHLDDLNLLEFDISDEGWTWVSGAAAERFQEVSGTATRAHVSAADNAANHYSHDFNVDVLVDEGQEGLVSLVGKDNAEDPRSHDTIEVEWETGTRPDEHRGEGESPTFPKWVWPSRGDRVWAEGHWVYDCGHPTDIDPEPPDFEQGDLNEDNRYRTEIHPARALASMREQSRTMPGSGTTPVPVTATDLYIHGNGGFMVEQLYCGMDIIITGEVCETTTSSIAEHFDFDICLPPKPAETARLGTLIREGPRNTIEGPDPVLQAVPASAACRRARHPGDAGPRKFDQNWMVHATVDLSGSGAPDEAVYGRRIYTGWIFPSSPPLRHFRLTLNEMDLHEDHDTDFGADTADCECTFFWLNVNRAETQGNRVENEWIRLQDFTEENMNDFDGDRGPGDGDEAEFSDAVFEFYVQNVRYPEPFGLFLQDTTVFANGYDQDCNDMRLMGGRTLSLSGYADCFAGRGVFENEPGREDDFQKLIAELRASEFHGLDYPGTYSLGTEDDEYEIEFTVEEIPLDLEDTADLGVDKTCNQETEVALVGEPVTCTITVSNPGPGLPRHVVVTDSIVTTLDSSQYSFTPSAVVGETEIPVPCTVHESSFTCDVGTVPVGEQATIVVDIVVDAGGHIDNVVDVVTDSTDPDPANNSAEVGIDVFQPIAIDVKPGESTATINTNSHGLISVAALSDADFQAGTLNVATLCFGDAEQPDERDCTEAHAMGHPEDVDLDGDFDLLLHYETQETGIDPGDTSACLIGTRVDGVGVYGCDAIEAM